MSYFQPFTVYTDRHLAWPPQSFRGNVQWFRGGRLILDVTFLGANYPLGYFENDIKAWLSRKDDYFLEIKCRKIFHFDVARLSELLPGDVLRARDRWYRISSDRRLSRTTKKFSTTIDPFSGEIRLFELGGRR